MKVSELQTLYDLIQKRVDQEQLTLLNKDVEEAHNHIEQIHSALTMVAKRSGRRHLIKGFSDRTTARIEGLYGSLHVGTWRVDEAVKVWLLANLAARSIEPNQLLFTVYAQGDTEAKVACLRALNFTHGSSQIGLELIHDAGRTYLNELMEAGWRDNPFAARYLSAEEYRKAVLKALFCQIDIEGFIGLESRADEELARSLCAYANEREAAGREVPSTLWPVAARFPSPGLVARLIGKLEHPASLERIIAARSLKAAADPRALPFLEDRLTREEIREVQNTLQSAIETTRLADPSAL